jgi:hypothetical protein
MMMKKAISALLFGLLLAAATGQAQETSFGKNKVRYKDFEWSYLQTRHFDIHFYENAYVTAKFAATVLESSYVEISRQLDYKLQRRVPIFIYNSHNDFQQTNIISDLLPEGVGGFTEAFKNRIVIPFSGSYEDFRHVLHHELTHAVIYDLIYGNALSSLISRQRLFNLPLWFAEGYAEYSSRHGWDCASDMYVRDATINGYLAPPDYLDGFLAYKQGQAMINYIVDKYGIEKLGEILRKGKVYLSMNKALKESIGITEEKFWEEFSKEMKRRYWPEIAVRKEAPEIAKELTKARKDGSYFNDKPAFSPDGDRIAIYTDRSDYTEIVMISAIDGKTIARLVKSERSGDLESLHSYVSGLSFSPDGTRFVFVAKSGGHDALMFYDLKKRDTYKVKRFDFYNVLSPAWSADGNMVAFSALRASKRDLFVYHLATDSVEQLTDDRYDDLDPSWLPNSSQLVFTSDRRHPRSYGADSTGNPHAGPGWSLPGDFKYGDYNLFRMNLATRAIEPLDVGPGQNTGPRVSPDGLKVAFLSNRNGIDNIYVAGLDSGGCYPVTDLLTGVRSLSWSPDGAKIAFSAFHEGGFDIFVLKDIVPLGQNDVLASTDYMMGAYDPAHQVRERPAPAQAAVSPRPPETLSGARSDTGEYAAYRLTASDLQKALDSTTADSARTATDSTATAGQAVPKGDTTAAKTGVVGDEYVYVSKEGAHPYDDYLVTVSNDSAAFPMPGTREPASFDSIPPPSPEGEYSIKKYKVRFTPDYVGGGFAYDTFFGLRGQTYFVFSDYLGNHQIVLATDLVNTIDQSNIQGYYFYSRHRTSLGVGVFHTKNFYVDANDFLFSDRFYGFQLFASRPSSVFSRFQVMASQYFINRQYYDYPYDTRIDRNTKVTTGELAYVTDNIVWGITGPINGRRSRLSVSGGVNLFDSDDIEFTSVELDYRKYWHFAKSFTTAFRLSGGASFGRTPKLYFLGGTTNWIGNRTLDAKVYEVENLYFSDVVTPLRGLPYYELSGNRYALINWELRFPSIEYLAMRFPLPLVLSHITGAIFTDVGSAWNDSEFKGGTSQGGNSRLVDIHTGFGFGMRANLGFLVLRYDLAWSTDFEHVSDHPSHYFSFGADF